MVAVLLLGAGPGAATVRAQDPVPTGPITIEGVTLRQVLDAAVPLYVAPSVSDAKMRWMRDAVAIALDAVPRVCQPGREVAVVREQERVGAGGDELSVGEVDEPHDAEDEADADGHQRDVRLRQRNVAPPPVPRHGHHPGRPEALVIETRTSHRHHPDRSICRVTPMSLSLQT